MTKNSLLYCSAIVGPQFHYFQKYIINKITKFFSVNYVQTYIYMYLELDITQQVKHGCELPNNFIIPIFSLLFTYRSQYQLSSFHHTPFFSNEFEEYVTVKKSHFFSFMDEYKYHQRRRAKTPQVKLRLTHDIGEPNFCFFNAHSSAPSQYMHDDVCHIS